MTNFPYDLLIIGGGPAGSSAAAFARQQNLRTLVVEKSAFPRFHIGESLLPMVNTLLRESGAWPKVEAAGFMPKYGAEFHTADGQVEKTVVFADGLVPGLESTFHVERSRFDALLLDHARELGAEVRMATRVASLSEIAAGFEVVLESSAGRESVRVPWVIDCTGRDPSLATDLKRELDPAALPKRLAIYNHFHGVARAAGKDGGNILVVRIDDGWLWLIPIDAHKTSVGLVTTVTAFREAAESPDAFFQKAVERSPKLRELLGGAIPLRAFEVTSDYSYFRKRLATDRLVLAGDAAGFFDPIFSSGVYVAVASARQAVTLIARAHAEQRGLTAHEQTGYTRDLKRHARVFLKMVDAFYDDDSFDVFMCQRIPKILTGGLTSIVAGHARLTWPLWWRFHFFLLVCRIQKRVKLVKPEHLRPLRLAKA